MRENVGYKDASGSKTHNQISNGREDEKMRRNKNIKGNDKKSLQLANIFKIKGTSKCRNYFASGTRTNLDVMVGSTYVRQGDSFTDALASKITQIDRCTCTRGCRHSFSPRLTST